MESSQAAVSTTGVLALLWLRAGPGPSPAPVSSFCPMRKLGSGVPEAPVHSACLDGEALLAWQRGGCSGICISPANPGDKENSQE